jgi:superfamily II DNA or RNA helicase
LVHNSATPRRADRSEPVFFHHIGPILHTMQAQSMPFQVRYLTSDSELQGIRRGDYSVSAGRMNSAQVISALADDAARTRHLAEDIALAVRKGRKVMVVSHRLEHLRAIKKDLRKVLAATLLPWPVAIEPYTGQWFTSAAGDDRRVLTKAELKKAEGANVLLCTQQLVSEGLDISALDVIVLATPLGDAEQAIGRVRRWCTPAPEKCAHYCPWRAGTCQGKPTPIVVDVRDPQVAWSERKARGRDKFYRRMGCALPTDQQRLLPVDNS